MPIRRNGETGRQVLRMVLLEPFVFELQPDGSCTFTAPGALGHLMQGSTANRAPPDTRVVGSKRESSRLAEPRAMAACLRSG